MMYIVILGIMKTERNGHINQLLGVREIPTTRNLNEVA